jgi:hypothetical protein
MHTLMLRDPCDAQHSLTSRAGANLQGRSTEAAAPSSAPET